MRKTALALCLAGVAAIAVPAQEKDATFEVASVKANKSGESNGNMRALPGGRVAATNMPVRPLITFAYMVAGYQLIGGPGWLASDRYDFIAKLEEGSANAVQPFIPG